MAPKTFTRGHRIIRARLVRAQELSNETSNYTESVPDTTEKNWITSRLKNPATANEVSGSEIQLYRNTASSGPNLVSVELVTRSK